MATAVGGIRSLSVDGERYLVKGSVKYDLGGYKREAVMGADGVHGYKETPKAPYIECEITDPGNLDVMAMKGLTASTITLILANGKTVVLRDGWYAGEGTVETEEGKIDFKFEGMSAEEIY